ncbi:MAG: phosphopantothenoylcysteine decarboxylase [Rubrivivax sp.]
MQRRADARRRAARSEAARRGLRRHGFAEADWRPGRTPPSRSSRRTARVSAPALAFVENPILATVAKLPAGERPFCVGFAAESHDIVRHAREAGAERRAADRGQQRPGHLRARLQRRRRRGAGERRRRRRPAAGNGIAARAAAQRRRLLLAASVPLRSFRSPRRPATDP